MAEIESVDINSFDKTNIPEVPVYPQSGSFLLGVKDGVTKLIPTDSFYYRNEEVASAASLANESPDNFLRDGDEVDAFTLGGKGVEEFATKDQLVGLEMGDYEWALPRMWFREDIMPDGREPYNYNHSADSLWCILNGEILNGVDFPELKDLLGDRFTYDKNELTGQEFRIPDFTGRVPIGVGGVSQVSQNLSIRDNYPQTIGELGGSSVGKLESDSQLIRHSHNIYDGNLSVMVGGGVVEVDTSGDDGAKAFNKAYEIKTTANTAAAGFADPWGFSVLNPCVGVVWIMRLKNPNRK